MNHTLKEMLTLLPNEVLDRILSHTDTKSLLSISLTSHQLHALAARQLYQQLQPRSHSGCLKLWRTLESTELGKAVRVLTLGRKKPKRPKVLERIDIDDRVLMGLVTVLRDTLEELLLTCARPSYLADVLATATNLKRVFLDHCEILEPSTSRLTPPPNSIHTLLISKCKFSLESLPPAIFPSLRNLRIQHDNGRTSSHGRSPLTAFLDEVPCVNLTRLRILLAPRWRQAVVQFPYEKAAWEAALRRFTNIEQLEIDWACTGLLDEGARPLSDDPTELGGFVNFLGSSDHLHSLAFYLAAPYWRQSQLMWTDYLAKHSTHLSALRSIEFCHWPKRFPTEAIARTRAEVMEGCQENLKDRRISVSHRPANGAAALVIYEEEESEVVL